MNKLHSISVALMSCLAAVCLCGLATAPHGLAKAQQTSSDAKQQGPADTTLPQGKKLVMKDGTSQIVSSYQVEGNRVRYFSVERSEWEEVPAAMVDWEATKKAQAANVKQEEALDEKVKAEEAAARAAPVDVDESLEVVPGVFLPPGEGIFILDGRAIFPLHPSAAVEKRSKKRLVEQVVVPVPIVPSRENVELAGAHASFRTTNPSPEFYMRTTDPGTPEVELIEARVHGEKRHLEDIDTLFMQHSEKGKTMSLQVWEVAKGVYRFTLGQPLKPGEYALAEISPKEGMNLLVWDFGVDRPERKSAQQTKVKSLQP